MNPTNIVINIANMRDGIKEAPDKGLFRVDRQTPLGNPYFLYIEDMRDAVCDKYDEWFWSQGRFIPKIKIYLDELYHWLVVHKEITLLCWCSPKRCHAETIRAYLTGR